MIRYTAFLSSFSCEDPLAGEDDELRKLRTEVHVMGQALAMPIWVAEHAPGDQEALAHFLQDRDALAVVDLLTERIAQSERFIGILAGRRRGHLDHGCPVNVGSTVAAVSHFEFELLQAVLHNRPITLFVVDGFDPGNRLAKLLELLRDALPDWQGQVRLSYRQIYQGIRRYLQAPPNQQPRAGTLLQRGLMMAREQAGSPLLLLDGHVEPRAKAPDFDFVDKILKEQVTLNNVQRKMGRLWLALREMMSLDYRRQGLGDEELLLWEGVVSMWSGNAAWSGMFAHIFGGVIACLNSLKILRPELTKRGLFGYEGKDPGPLEGAYASAYYSLARREDSFLARRRMLNLSLKWIRAGLAAEKKPSFGMQAVHGSILLRLYRPYSAMEAFTRAGRILEKADDIKVDSIALNLSDMGQASICGGDLLRGLDLLERSVELAMSQQNETTVRILKRAGAIYGKLCMKSASRELLGIASDLAIKLGTADQLAQIRLVRK